MQRFAFLVLPLLLLIVAAGCGPAGAQELPSVTVYKSPTCGCCAKWVDHLEAAGFTVNTTDMPNVTPMKKQLGVPETMYSCHTAVVDGYVVEGHVPSDVLKRFLEEKPDATGLAVPGMPMGSPGMEGAYRDAYDIVAFDHRGESSVYEHIEGDR